MGVGLILAIVEISSIINVNNIDVGIDINTNNV